MSKKIGTIIISMVMFVILIIGLTACGNKKISGNNEKEDNSNSNKLIEDFAKYISNNEIGKVIDLIDIDEYDKVASTNIDKEQLQIILESIDVKLYEISNIRKATEEDIRDVAEEYGTYESFIETYKDYEQYAVDYKLSIDGSTGEAKDIFFIKEENGTYSLVTSKVWQGLISYNYMIMMNNTPVEGEQ